MICVRSREWLTRLTGARLCIGERPYSDRSGRVARVRDTTEIEDPGGRTVATVKKALISLAQLHNQGVLTDDAYAAAKRRILEQDKQPQPPGPASSPTRPPAS